MPDKLVNQEFSELFIKTLFPAFLIVAVGAAIEMKNDRNKISWINIALSFFIAVAFSYLVKDVVMKYSPEGWYTVCVCIIALSSEKIVKWFMNHFKVDLILTALMDLAVERIKKIFK